jgi:Family of unknown function (DUF6455)
MPEILKCARETSASISQFSVWIDGWRKRGRLRRELESLRRRGELDRTLIDNGIAPCEVSRLLRMHPGAPEQLPRMMGRLGIDRASLPRNAAVIETLRAMEWSCGECGSWRKCRSWLAASEPRESYRAFCPNAERLDELRCSDGARSGFCSKARQGVLAELDAASP